MKKEMIILGKAVENMNSDQYPEIFFDFENGEIWVDRHMTSNEWSEYKQESIQKVNTIQYEYDMDYEIGEWTEQKLIDCVKAFLSSEWVERKEMNDSQSMKEIEQYI
ncbi:MAG: hypothetical protein CVU92_09570 [Firmicutes bacterium HGW-Firmicutes-17]|nr:MAG: hypothetical protein CVU92_09570 [Firmicutes bacterium HGW-Firmicutes-17]